MTKQIPERRTLEQITFTDEDGDVSKLLVLAAKFLIEYSKYFVFDIVLEHSELGTQLTLYAEE